MIIKEYGTDKNILVAPELAMTVGARVDNTGLSADDDGKKILYAGTPLFGDIADRLTAFIKASTSGAVAGVYTIQITTEFIVGDMISIDDVIYTCAATADADAGEFAVGTSATEQATSLKAVIKSDNYTITTSTSSLIFTQKVASESLGAPAIAVDKEATGVFGDLTETTPADDGANNAVAILLHDVDVTDAEQNATIVLNGTIDLLKLTDDTASLITIPVKEALDGKINFIKGAK